MEQEFASAPEGSGQDSAALCRDEIIKSLRKNRHYHAVLFSRFTKAVKDYRLVGPGDRIAVCVSGGKKSMLMARLFLELKRHNKFPFELIFISLDAGSTQEGRELTVSNAGLLGLPLQIFAPQTAQAGDHVEHTPCDPRPGEPVEQLFAKAEELGCNKIALGQIFDDVIVKILSEMIGRGRIQTLMPRLRSEKYTGMELIRPMYYVHEDDIDAWCRHVGLHFLPVQANGSGDCTQTAVGQDDIGRLQARQLIRSLRDDNPFLEQNIFRSVENINLARIIGWCRDGQSCNFLDGYNK